MFKQLSAKSKEGFIFTMPLEPHLTVCWYFLLSVGLCNCSSHALVFCSVKLRLWACFLTYLSFSHAVKVRNILPRCFRWNSKSRKMVIVENSQTCCCWQVCERSGAKPKAIKSSVRGHAKHDGKLQQWGEQSSKPVSLFIRHHPHPPPLLQLQDRHSPKHPSSAFHTPVWSKQAAVWRLSLPEREGLWDR